MGRMPQSIENFILYLALLVFAPTVGIAQVSENRFITYVDASYYAYEEPNVMSKKSSIPLIGLGVGYTSPHNYPISLNASINLGQTAYEGTGTTDNDPLYILNGEIAKQIAISPISIKFGYGLRYLYDDWGIKKTTTNYDTYDRSSLYSYMFASFAYKLNSNQFVTFKIKTLMNGKQQIFIDHVDAYRKTSMAQKRGFGIDVEWAMNEQLSLFARSWRIKESEPDVQDYGLIEPENTTIQLGLRHRF
jgi:hypothetical protein